MKTQTTLTQKNDESQMCSVNTETEIVSDKAKNKKRAAIWWTVYWLLIFGIYIAVSLVFKNFAMFAIVPVLAAVFFLIRLATWLAFGKVKNKKIKLVLKISANAASLAVTLGICAVIISNGSSYNEVYIASLDYSVFDHQSTVTYDSESGVYTVRAENEQLRILQLTDVHICGSITTIGTDRKAFDACYELIKEAQPDLIIVTGDIVFPIPLQTFNKNNLKPIFQFGTFMNNVGIPWAMVYGNHDTEAVATYDSKTFDGIFRHFTAQDDCPMLYADIQPDIYGRYNQYLRIENSDGSLNRLIFLMDSNDYVKNTTEINDYDSIHEDQIKWYSETIDRISAEENSDVSSFVFMHIPFEEFADAKYALDAGDPNVVYLFGENREGVSHPDRNSGFFDKMLDKKSTEAVFVGHDHLNNMGINYRGIDLVYSKSIDYIAYPGISKMTEQRGATLITVSQNGKCKIEQIDYTK